MKVIARLRRAERNAAAIATLGFAAASFALVAFGEPRYGLLTALPVPFLALLTIHASLAWISLDDRALTRGSLFGIREFPLRDIGRVEPLGTGRGFLIFDRTGRLLLAVNDSYEPWAPLREGLGALRQRPIVSGEPKAPTPDEAARRTARAFGAVVAVVLVAAAVALVTRAPARAIDLLFLALVATQVAAVILVRRSEERLVLFSNRFPEPRPSTGAAYLLCAFALGALVLFKTQPWALSWARLGIFATLFSMFFVALGFAGLKPVDRFSGAIVVFLGTLTGIAATLAFDVAFDPRPPDDKPVRIVARHLKTVKLVPVATLEVEDPASLSRHEITVPLAVFEQVADGDTIVLWIKPGNLGLPWIEGISTVR